MNFLIRSASTYNASAADQVVGVNESSVGTHYASKESKPKMTLEGLIADDSFFLPSITEEHDGEMDGSESGNAAIAGSSVKKDSFVMEDHSDVSEGEGWIIIPNKGLPDTWNDVADISSLQSLDRSFVFPGEQVHILACLSACKQETETITPFKVAAVMHKNGMGQISDKQNGHVKDGRNTTSGEGDVSFDSQVVHQNGNEPSKYKIDPQKDISASESLLRMEDHKKQTEMLLQRFVNSHFFVRIAESGEPLWSRKSAADPDFAEMDGKKSTDNGIRRTSKSMSRVNALIDMGDFDANVSGGVARNTVNCFSLSNGDIVVCL
uniref:Uncharacterized protein MANES_05G096500 n=1 Tax=Rhizophora mucronata TaxID=61149 RepID=A0A2P2K9Y8_RHIMU